MIYVKAFASDLSKVGKVIEVMKIKLPNKLKNKKVMSSE